MRVLIYGGSGWLAGRFADFYRARTAVVAVSRRDITDAIGVACDLRTWEPDLVFNAAGHTHTTEIPSIDACVASDAAKRKTLASNALGAGQVALETSRRGIRLVHLSSGCLFDGDGPFDETSTPNPVSWYAQTKLLGETLVQAADPAALILRIRMPISAEPHPRNLITKLAQAEHVIDVTNSVTVIEDLLPFAATLSDAGISGVVHAVHPEPVTSRQIMAWYQEIVDPSHRAVFINKADFQTADGRSNAVLRSARSLPMSMPPAEAAIRRALTTYATKAVAV